MSTLPLIRQNPTIPLITAPDATSASDTAKALLEGGIRIIEVALRSEAALAGIEAIRRDVPDMIVGAGTVRHAEQLERVIATGVAYAVTPGITHELLEAASHWELPLLPGAMTPSEIMTLSDRGFEVVKLFPCGELGGLDFVRAMSGPFADMHFCPSGGINSENFLEYLRLDSIVGVGGSFLAPPDAIEEKDWDRITRIARTVTHKLDAR